MFARLNGTLDSILDNAVILDVHGVGYLVTCSGRTLARLEGPGQPLRLHIETHVREEAIALYGFLELEERDWFRLLTTVQGVGARVAMNILSVCNPSDLYIAIMAQDKTVVARADGVGPKLATRIVTELKDKAAKLVDALPIAPSRASTTIIASTTAPAGGGAEGEAISALVNLGYGRAEAFAAVMKIRDDEGGQNMGDLVKRALAELMRSAA